MDNKGLKPQMFDTDINDTNCANKRKHWKRTFENYVAQIEGTMEQDKLVILVSFLDTSVYTYISECKNFNNAITRLNQAYAKLVNEVFARYLLNTCQQNEAESLEHFLERPKSSSSNCNFSDCTSAQIKEAAVRDAFISGLQSGYIRQRILKDNILELIDVVDKARRLEEARRNATLNEVQNRHQMTESTATAAPCKIPYDKRKEP